MFGSIETFRVLNLRRSGERPEGPAPRGIAHVGLPGDDAAPRRNGQFGWYAESALVIAYLVGTGTLGQPSELVTLSMYRDCLSNALEQI